MRIMSIVISCMYHPDIRLSNIGLLGKFVTDKILCNFQITIEQPAYQPHRKHITTFQHRFIVHTCAGKTIFHHLRNRSSNNILLDSHLLYRISGLKLCLFQIPFLKSIRIYNDTSRRFGKFILSFQCCSIHGNQYVTLVAWSVNLIRSDMHLKTGNASQRTLRGTNVCRIVRKCTDVITYSGRYC